MNIIELLEIKKNNFKMIQSIAEQQESMVNDDLMQDYLQSMAKRDRLKKEIDADSKKYKNISEQADRREREMARSMNREIAEVIESIMDIDKRIEALIKEKKKDVLEEIKGLKKGRTAVKGYGQKKGQAQPRFIKTIG